MKNNMDGKGKRKTMQNRLLAAFPPDGLSTFKPMTQEIDLTTGTIVFAAHEPVEYLYFPDDCVISLLAETAAGSSIEIAAVANEGIVGIASLLHEPIVPYKAVVQIPGTARRIKREFAEKFFEEQIFFSRMVLRYFHALLTQMAQSSVCNSFHSIEQRMSRWLLMHSDRSGANTLPFTHEFLAGMLGTRRESVTQIIGKFEKLKWVQSSRGNVTITGRDQLETIACECYTIVKEELNRMFASFVR